MAASKSARPVEGFTRQAGPSGPVTRVRPAGFILQDADGNDWYFWPTGTTGALRFADAATAEADGFNWTSGGAAV